MEPGSYRTRNMWTIYSICMHIWLLNSDTKPTYFLYVASVLFIGHRKKAKHASPQISPIAFSQNITLLSSLSLSSHRIVQPRPGWKRRCNYGNEMREELFQSQLSPENRAAVGLRKQTPLSSYHKYGLPLDSSRPVSPFTPSINACAFQLTSGALRPWGCFSPLLLAQLVRLPVALALKWPEVKKKTTSPLMSL